MQPAFSSTYEATAIYLCLWERRDPLGRNGLLSWIVSSLTTVLICSSQSHALPVSIPFTSDRRNNVALWDKWFKAKEEEGNPAVCLGWPHYSWTSEPQVRPTDFPIYVAIKPCCCMPHSICLCHIFVLFCHGASVGFSASLLFWCRKNMARLMSPKTSAVL